MTQSSPAKRRNSQDCTRFIPGISLLNTSSRRGRGNDSSPMEPREGVASLRVPQNTDFEQHQANRKLKTSAVEALQASRKRGLREACKSNSLEGLLRPVGALDDVVFVFEVVQRSGHTRQIYYSVGLLPRGFISPRSAENPCSQQHARRSRKRTVAACASYSTGWRQVGGQDSQADWLDSAHASGFRNENSE